jgi:hypothetical protein
MDRLSRFALSLALGAGLLPAAFAAHAVAPYIEQFDFVVEGEPMAGCGDFEIIADGAGSNRITTYFDGSGAPVRVAFHGRYNGSMTNSVTGYSIMDSPSVANITFDLVQGTQTNIGAFFTVTVPGAGAVLMEAGRIVFDGSGPPIFIAGPHLPPGATIGALCEALRNDS